MSTLSMRPCQKWILSLARSLPADKLASPTHWGLFRSKKKRKLPITRQPLVCFLVFFLFLPLLLPLSSPSPALKATQEEINHEGEKTQLHRLAAGHSSYFVWNWLSESRSPARGGRRLIWMKRRGLISLLHIPHSVSTLQPQSNTPLSWIDKRNWIPS